MNALDVICFAAALGLFLAAGFGVPAKVSLGWLGAAAIALDLLLHALGVG